MKDVIKQHLSKLNETSYKVFRYYNKNNPALSTWTVVFFNGGIREYTYNNVLVWNGLIGG